MDIAIVAPCPIPYMIGGAENLWSGLQRHLNEHTPHQAEIIKLPSRELSFWELIDSYRHFAELDLTGFDLVVSSKYPAWMVGHPNHVVYMLHRLRGLYDTYDVMNLPHDYADPPPAVRDLRAFMAEHGARREALPEFFARVAALRGAPGVREDLFAFPGPFIRELVHFLDGIGARAVGDPALRRDLGRGRRAARLLPARRRRLRRAPADRARGAARRARALPVHGQPARRAEADRPADRGYGAGERGRRAADRRRGPEEARLRELAAGDARISFCGRVGDAELAELYAGARAVAFIPQLEDFGLVTLEAMLAGKPVITCTDSGGTAELVSDGVTGLVVEPEAAALAAAIERLWSSRREARRMGEAGRERARQRCRGTAWSSS